GMGGDKIQMRDGVVWLNDKPIARKRVADFVENGERTPRYQETLPNGRTYFTLDENPHHIGDNTDAYYVPAEHYFMMGDNRDNSTDSRFTHYVGYVPHDNLVGPARVLFFSLGDRARFWEIWRWGDAIRFDRLLTIVK
ncbi:MAG: signal peptidase I, partial [Alphaproteobacteria bacterium]|nr:signal peptidase I [Alphaproteobacteria bacterium]